MARSKKGKNTEQTDTFGGRVRAIRKSLKLLQEDFAPQIKISSQHLSDIELDKSKPCHDFFYNIVKNYNVNLDYLLFGKGEMFAGSEEEVVTDGKKFKTGDENIDKFLYYFFNSRMVQGFVMYQFWRFYSEEKTAIKKDLENSEEEEKEK